MRVSRADRYQAISLSRFPKSFETDLNAWLARLREVDYFADEGPARALRPITLRNVKATVRQTGSALVGRGHAIESITSLRALVEPNNFKEILRFFLDRNGGKPTTWLWGLAGNLLAIAKYHVKLTATELEKLGELRSRIKIESERVTEKNRQRLRQFDDEYNVELLLLLPRRIIDRAKKAKESSSRVALDIMYAIAIEILLACPMRMNNLVSIDIDRHFFWRGNRNDQVISIYVPDEETKNRVAIECDLGVDTTSLVRLYLHTFRALVSVTPDNWLFPASGGGGHRGPDHLSQGLSNLIHRETGLIVNGHFFRHLAGKLYLERRPGGHETVRQFLRHKKLDTTTTFYTGLDSKRANQHYYEVVLSQRHAGRGER